MKFSRCILSLLAAISVTQKVTATVTIVSPKIKVQYSVEYPDALCSTAPNPPQVTVEVPARSVALIVMQEAANDDSQLRFTATYFGSDLGYFVDVLNGTSSDLENKCFWLIYIRTPNGKEFPSPLGVSSYVLPGTGYSLIWRYTRTGAEAQSLTNSMIQPKKYLSQDSKIVVKYVIEYRDQDVCGPGLVAPPQVYTKIPIQGSAQQVMENAVDYGKEYRFTASFFNYELGYFIDGINGTSGNIKTNCFWLFYIRLPNNREILPNVGVTNYVIPANGYSVIMRYQIAEHVDDRDPVAAMGLTDDQSQPKMLMSILSIAMLFTTIMTVY